jgi:hypothetical protein
MKSDLININSLTDIISNSVGILILFAVLNIVYEGGKVYKLEVPLEYESSLIPAFFLCKDNAIIFLQPEIIFTNAIIQANKNSYQEKTIFSLDYMDIKGQIVKDYALLLHANDTTSWSQKIDDNKIRQVLDKLDSKKQFAFFFVYDDLQGNGFAIYRQARQYLKERHIKSGWQPVNKNNPASICFWGDVPACNRYFPSK